MIIKMVKREYSANGTYRNMEGEIMNARSGLLLGLVLLGLLCAIGTAAADNTTSPPGLQPVNDIPAYNGTIGASSPLYGLKIAFENLDDSFTFNQTERLEKEMGHADLRIAELKSALAANQTSAADLALDQYWQNLNQTERTLDGFNTTGTRAEPTGTGLGHAQDMLVNHQVVLENVLLSHPGDPALARAYNTSRDLEMKFEQTTRTRFEQLQGADNRTWLRAEPLSPGRDNRTPSGALPADQEVRYGLSVNRDVAGAGNQSWQPGTQTSRQDGNRPVIKENRIETGNRTGVSTGNDNNNRNEGLDTGFRTR